MHDRFDPRVAFTAERIQGRVVTKPIVIRCRPVAGSNGAASEKYRSKEFTEALSAHLHRAKRLALADQKEIAARSRELAAHR